MTYATQISFYIDISDQNFNNYEGAHAIKQLSVDQDHLTKRIKQRL